VNTDIVIIGGGAAGTTAALVLARARHHITLIDDHTYRNATVDTFHGFPTRDGTSPTRFRSEARRELNSYGVRLVERVVANARTTDRTVTIELDDGSNVDAAAMLLATGVQDELPAIDGLTSRWGTSVFNCPFCDGWEQRDRPVVVIDAAPGAEDLARLVSSWTSHVTVVKADDIRAITGAGTDLGDVVLRNGTTLDANAAFLRAPVIPRTTIARQIGCDLDQAGYLLTDECGATSHPLVWAAGDVRRPPPAPHQVVLAAADGSAAAIAIHKAFVLGATSTSRRNASVSNRDRTDGTPRSRG
jgi:thioredoxin reductase